MKITDVKSTLTTDLGYHELFMYPALSRILRLLKAHDMKELSVEAYPDSGSSNYVYKKHWWRNKAINEYSYLDSTLTTHSYHNIKTAINQDLSNLIQYVFGSLDFAQRRHILISIKAKKKYTIASLKFLHQAPDTENLVSKTKFVMDEIDLTVEYDNEYNRVGTWDPKTGHITYFSNSADLKSENPLSDSEIEDNGVAIKEPNVREVKNPQLKEISTDTTSTIGKAFWSLYARDVEPRGFAALAGRIAVAPPPTKTDIEQEIRSRILSVVDEIVNKIVYLTDLSVEDVSPHVYVESNEINEYSPINIDITIGIAPTLVKHLNLLGITKEQIFGDETDTESETDNEPVAVSEVSEPESVEITPVAEAQESILDKVKIPELTNVEDYGMGAGRITVDDKAMINCESDLNQLVPFKYSWAWQGYLKGAEHHWMPQEQDLRNDDWGNASAAETKAITSAIFDMKCWSIFKSRDPLLCIYEFVTNPEVRQYILRQRFEHTVWGNFVDHVVMSYQSMTTNHTPSHFNFTESQYLAYSKCVQVDEKIKTRNDMLDSYCTGEFVVTPKLEDMANSVRFLINFYINHVFIFNFTSLIQMMGYLHSDWGTNPNCKYEGLAKGFELIFRDVVLQMNIGISVINTIIEENPKLKDWLSIDRDWYSTILNAKTVEIQYMDWWANTQSYKTTPEEQANTLSYMVDLITNSLGMTDTPLDTNKSAIWFIELYNKYVPTYTKQDTVVGSSSSGAALSWDATD